MSTSIMNASQLPLKSDNDLIQAVYATYDAHGAAGAPLAYSERVAKAFGYTPEQLKNIPSEANMGLSCGNPVAAASIKEGECVLDLGSGGGIDIFLAASKVGPKGQAIGLDMSENMIKKARKNARQQMLYPPQVAFVHAKLTDPLPIASDSIDCVLSNCVINLLPPAGKAHLMQEVNRVLKPGGRFVLDDILAKSPLPEHIKSDMASYVACISGAMTVQEYEEFFSGAGFQDAIFVDTKASYQIYALKSDLKSDHSQMSQSPLLNWWDAYPAVQSKDLPRMTAEDLAVLIQDPTQTSYAVIDVRRNDHAGGHVRGSSQWPAQTFYDDLEKFFERYKETEKVIFYCGSSNGRGPRCAGWYQDYLSEVGSKESKAYVLQGGIKEWLQRFGDEEALVDSD
ncbi:hypothetical protein HWV62_22544 [Athelia sp. TMB]|nr:hypothetical protein HWV62_22544 [Athelia sp. TMB]